MNTTQLSTSGMIQAALDQLVELVAALGIPATRDPSELQPPAVIIAAPTIQAGTLATIGLSVPVYAVSDTPGQAGLDWLLDTVTAIMAELGETSSEPTIYTSPLNPAGLPAYLVTVQMNVSQGG